MKASGTPPAATRSRPSGTGTQCAAGTVSDLGLPAAAHEAEDPISERGCVSTSAPERDHLAGELESRDVGRDSGRGGVEAGALREVGAVQPGAVDADEDLAAARASGSGRVSTTSWWSAMTSAAPERYGRSG